MASFNTTTYTAQNAPASGSYLNYALNGGGKLRIQQVKYALAGTEAAADTINLCKVPAGAVAVTQLCSVFCQDPGTTLTLDIGYASNTDALADGITLSSGGLVNFTSGTAPADTLTPVAIASADSTIVATVASANTLTADAILVFNIVYSVE